MDELDIYTVLPPRIYCRIGRGPASSFPGEYTFVFYACLPLAHLLAVWQVCILNYFLRHSSAVPTYPWAFIYFFPFGKLSALSFWVAHWVPTPPLYLSAGLKEIECICPHREPFQVPAAFGFKYNIENIACLLCPRLRAAYWVSPPLSMSKILSASSNFVSEKGIEECWTPLPVAFFEQVTIDYLLCQY